ncbi:BON domain-containing protein [Emticicia sp. CRIBPO]|uniref:BON domain-containing protein n=1 Tax=Emticicia sp. CRIBPO TaxID=2683258 RepID=UPI001413446D|nr:BON domain-containing protein [Emticicia sp. CRIBPO]NBA85645.1 BON domain-containing protein [Emticicia sp. CRIBPO]
MNNKFVFFKPGHPESQLRVAYTIRKIEILQLKCIKKDKALAKTVAGALLTHWKITGESIAVKVKNGCVSLEGKVLSSHEKEVIMAGILRITGVRKISDNIAAEN